MEKFEAKNLKGKEPIVESGGVVFDDFDVRYFGGAKEAVDNEFEDNLEQTKKLVDDILGSEWKIGEGGLKINLFSDQNKYKEYLKRNFPKIPADWATFDQKTNSIFSCDTIPEGEKTPDFYRSKVFSGVGHEMAHLHPFFGGVGNKASKGKWEQEMVCVFVQDKVGAKMGSDLMQKISMERAKKELEKFKDKEKTFSLKEADTDWENFYSLERLFYPWLEKKYGMEKLRQLWTTLFKEKKGIGKSLKGVYGEDIDDMEKQFKNEVDKTEDYKEFFGDEEK
jgi:hypothetical protein